MKKITGKVVSLVLALALVVTSFSSSFAFATTKTMAGIVSDTDKNSIYLVNGGTSDATKQSPELNAWIIEKLQTNTRDDVDDVKVDAISHVSGDSLVSLKTESDGDNAYLKLKSKSVKGTEVISVLYKGTYTNDDGDDYTVKARKNFTVYVYDKDTPILAEVKDSGDPSVQPGVDSTHPNGTPGKGCDDLTTFAKTRNTVETVGLYLAEPATSTDATLKYAPIYVTTNKDGIATSAVPAGVSIKDSGYYLDITDGDSDVHFNSDATGTALTGNGLVKLNADANSALKMVSGSSYDSTAHIYTKDASTSNVTFTLKRLKDDGKVSTSSDDKYTLKTKVEKKVNIAQAYANYTSAAMPTSWTVKKSNGRTRLDGVVDLLSSDGKATDPKYLDVTDCILDFPQGTTSTSIGDDEDAINVKSIIGYVGRMDIGEDAHVGSVDVDGGVITVNGKVGNITTDDGSVPALPDDGSVIVKGKATTGDIDTGDADSSSATGAVEIDGGTVGAVNVHHALLGKLTIDGEDSDDAIITGVLSASDMSIYSDEAKVSIAGITVNDENGTIDLQGDNLTIKAVDLNSYATTLQLGDDAEDDQAFVGTIPAVKNAASATIKTENEDTKATITGDLTADTIDMDSDTQLTLNGNNNLKTIEGDGTMTIAAGKLYVTDSVSSTKLKLSDKTLAAGTVVFKSDSDTVNEDDFDCYGFTLAKSASGSVDTFKIASLSFAGVAISGGSAELVPGQSATYTATAYPNGTALPAGYTVSWDLDGGSDDVFTMTSTGNTATVKANKVDATFASENKTTLTATLYDADGYDASDSYPAATFDITATTTPSAKSDTTVPVSVAKGASYTMKVTSTTAPAVTTGSNGVFSVVLASKNGNDYFYKLTATGAVGASTGVYLNGNKIFVATVKAFAFTCDTSKDTTVKGAYTFKITSATTPTVSVGSAAFKLAFVSKTGNAYLYKITSAGAAGTKVGVYVNGAKAFVAIVG